jgi:AAA domain-containing protein
MCFVPRVLAVNERWTRLNLIIAHSTEPHLWIQDINQSPFDLGFPVELDNFNGAQVSELSSSRRKRSTAKTAPLNILCESKSSRPKVKSSIKMSLANHDRLFKPAPVAPLRANRQRRNG